MELCKLSAGAGFAAISLSGAQIRDLAKEACSKFAIREVCWEPEEGLSLTETALAAEKLGAQVLILPAQAAEAENLGAVIAETNLRIAFENSCAGENLADMVDHWNHSLGTNRFFACLNTGHAIVSGVKPERMASCLGSRLLAVHVNDNHGKRDSCLLPYRGRNAMDWTAFLRKLADVQFDGTFWMDVRGPVCQSSKITEDWIRGQFAMTRYLQQTVEDYRNPETRPQKLRQWLWEEVRSGVLGTTLDVTYLHLSQMPTPEGFLPEAAFAEPREMRSASAAVYALLMLENQMEETARAVLSYILDVVKEGQLPQIPGSVGENREVLEERSSINAGAKVVLSFAKTCLKDENAAFEEAYYDICRRQMCICVDAVENNGETDFCTLSFVGAAAEAMCRLAQRRREQEVVDALEQFGAHIRRISEHLLEAQTDWRLFAPLAAGWNGIDRQCAENAMCSLEARTRIYDEAADIHISMGGYDAQTGVRMQQSAYVVGWMIEHARLRKDYEAIGEWARFFKQYQKRDYVLAENFSYQNGKWCFGGPSGVEDCAWFCMMLYRLRRELQKEGG